MNNGNYNGAEPLKGQQAPVAKSESMDSLTHGKDDETGKVTFSKGGVKNGDSVVEINLPDVVFSGMGKEELSRYANDPVWVRVRWSLFILFWLAWFSMLAVAVIIVVTAPKCSPPPKLTDFQKGAAYEVFTHSFQDGTEEQDGFGDLKGILNRLDHFTYLGVDEVILAPIFKSKSLEPQGYGYGISNFVDVDAKLGTLEDLESLTEAAKKKNVKILLDLVPNHSSDQHPWFLNSVKSEGNYTNYYVWKAGVDGNPPDSRLSVFGDSAWTLNEERKEWYLHQFGSDQPDLNYDDANVRKELMDILHFWLARGVRGFRLNAVDRIFEDNQDQVFGLLGEIRELLKRYEDEDGLERILLTDSSGIATVEAAIKYGTGDNLTVVPFNFDLVSEIETNFNGLSLNSTIASYLESVPSWGWPVWVSGSEYKSRVASRLGAKMIDAMAMVQILLPGTPSLYYGEEIGMVDVESIKTAQSCQNASIDFNCDTARTPMQWNGELNAGFSSSNSTWLPIPNDFAEFSVEKEKTGLSHLSVYKALLNIRAGKAFMYGDMGFPVVDEEIFSFIRVRKGAPGYLIIVNVGDKKRSVNFSKSVPLVSRMSEGDLVTIPKEAKVAVQSVGFNNTFTKGESVATSSITLDPKEGLVLSFVPVY